MASCGVLAVLGWWHFRYVSIRTPFLVRAVVCLGWSIGLVRTQPRLSILNTGCQFSILAVNSHTGCQFSSTSWCIGLVAAPPPLCPSHSFIHSALHSLSLTSLTHSFTLCRVNQAVIFLLPMDLTYTSRAHIAVNDSPDSALELHFGWLCFYWYDASLDGY